MFSVNVFGPLYLMQAAVPHMPRGGRIVNIGTIASKMGLTGNPVFIASKAAVDAMTFSMAQEVNSTYTSIPSDQAADKH